MKNSWEKRYTFRLTENEEELGKFLESINPNNKSEMIRNMLVYSFHQIEREHAKQKEIAMLRNEVQQLKEQLQQNHEEMMKRLDNLQIAPKESVEEKQQEENVASAESIRATAMAFLGGF